MQYHSCVCAFLGMQSPRIGLIPVLEGFAFHYIGLKCLFGTVTKYPDILFGHFCLKMQNGQWKGGKSRPLLSNILGRAEKGKQASFFFFFYA